MNEGGSQRRGELVSRPQGGRPLEPELCPQLAVEVSPCPEDKVAPIQGSHPRLEWLPGPYEIGLQRARSGPFLVRGRGDPFREVRGHRGWKT